LDFQKFEILPAYPIRGGGQNASACQTMCRHLGFLQIQKFTFSSDSEAHYKAISHADRSTGCRDMSHFKFFKMAAILSHLGFLKVQTFNCRSDSKVQYASPYLISCGSVKSFPGYGEIGEIGSIEPDIALLKGSFLIRRN